jgi:NADPH2:quinone reductase
MHAIRIHQFGGPEVLQYDDMPTAEPGPGEARVRLEASGVNFIDIYHRTGSYRGQLPLTLGQEGAGVVEAVGEGVSEVAPGDRVVYSNTQGAYATQQRVAAWKLVVIPAGIPTEVAAAVHLQGLTAQYLTESTYPLKPGDTALIHAAAGGVGGLLVQLAKRRGARIIATVGTDAKAEQARAHGADEVIVYTRQDFAAEARRLTGGRGVDVVYDSVGKDTFDQSLNCLHPRGMMVLYGQSSGAVPPMDPQTLNAKGSLYLTRPTLAHYTATREELLHRTQELFDAITAGTLDVRIARTFPLIEAGAAQTFLASRQALGKVLLIPS